MVFLIFILMLWLILLIILLVNVSHGYIQKYLVNTVSVARVTLVMFMVSFVCAFVFHFVFFKDAGTIVLVPAVVGVAALNALATWIFAHAVRLHMTKSVLIIPMTEIISVFFMAIFLGEWVFLNPKELSGATLLLGSFLGILALFFFGVNSESRENNYQPNRKWLFLIILPVLIWGFVNFTLKFFSEKKVPMNIFLISWYGGALLGMFVVALVAAFVKKTFFKKEAKMETENSSIKRLSAKLVFPSLVVLGLLTIGSLGLFYYALSFGPGILVLSAEELLKLLGGVLVGLFVFQEKKTMRRRDWYGLGVASVGIVFLITSSILK